MNTYSISKNNKQHELQQIKTILENNKYPPHILKNKKFKNKNKYNTINTTQKPKWDTFTYIGQTGRNFKIRYKNTHTGNTK
jgi:hypothetical protein